MEKRTVCFLLCCYCYCSSGLIIVYFFFFYFSIYKENEKKKPFPIILTGRFYCFLFTQRKRKIHRRKEIFVEMLYQEVYRLWQVHQKTNRSIRSLVAQSSYKVIVVVVIRFRRCFFLDYI